jgi:hypothetical protein
MSLEYLRILRPGDEVSGQTFVVMGKVFVIICTGLLLIYFGYKILGKLGAFIVLLIEVFIFSYANGLIPFL